MTHGPHDEFREPSEVDALAAAAEAAPAPLEYAALPSAVAPPAGTMGARMVRGATWIMIQSVLAQILALAARVILYRKLQNEDIAIATFAVSGCAFLGWLQPAITEVLIQRQSTFKRWATTAFWMTCASGGLMITGGLVLGPLLGLAYHNWIVMPLVITATISNAVGGIGTVCAAQLTIAFRFRTLAGIAVAGSMVVAGLTIAMAMLGCGAWTLVLPALIANMATLGFVFRAAPFRPRGKPRLLKAISLVKPAVTMSTAMFLSNLVLQADNFLLGIYHRESLPAYALAFSFSFQLIQLISRSLRGVLLPALSALDSNLERRDAAYLEAIELACFLSMPGAILIIPAARFGLLAIFSNRWESAVEMFQTFLLGMGFIVVHSIAFTAMQSRAHFRRYLYANILLAIVFFAVIWPCAAFGSAIVVARAVTAFYMVGSLVVAVWATAPSPLLFKIRIILAELLPFALACCAACAGWLATHFAGFSTAGLLGAALCYAVGFVAYTVLAYIFLRSTFRAAMRRLVHAVPHRFRFAALK